MIKRTLFFGQPAYLSTRNGQLVIKYPEKGKDKISLPIEDIGLILLENRQLTFTHGLIDALLQNKSALITCDEKHMPSGLILPMVGHTEQTRRIRDQLEMSVPLKKFLWQQTVRAKILNQASHLEEHNLDASRLKYWVRQVKSGDSDNHEALSAAYYWQSLFADMDCFIREADGDPPNNLLNYGYAILRAVTARALVSSGLFPSIGINHHNKYNAYCLADDIMEPYRIYVDTVVRDIVDSGESMDNLNPNLKARLLKIPAMDVRLSGQRKPLAVAMSTTTSSLYDCISGRRKKIKYPVYEPQPILKT